ncbi:hypothetical protein ElyMa_000275600 [Elysia marginata]|uniref:G-protein coupled receptors family 1 profile domain-containing protein n=1 Tax=Elysia marginata TaxID=1093978 RepID=A0AAV4F7M1_9GAST|nr:hypothetical protein ElyMa_000275600 [Elysia marginata]
MATATALMLTVFALVLLAPIVHAQNEICAYMDLIYQILLSCPQSKNPLCGIVDFFEHVIFSCAVSTVMYGAFVLVVMVVVLVVNNERFYIALIH